MAAQPPPQTQAQWLLDATAGFDKLLNNDLPGAREKLSGEPDSPFHLVGLGVTAFLQAALSQEDKGLVGALNILSKAEAAAASQMASRGSKDESLTVYPIGTEHKLLIADSVLCQALVHILTENYLEFMKAIYKLNRAYKGYSAINKTVFPSGVHEDDSLHTIFRRLNETYAAKKLGQSLPPAVSGSGFFGWGKKRTDHLRASPTSLRHSNSASALSSIAKSNGLKTPLTKEISASTPTSVNASPGESVTDLSLKHDAMAVPQREDEDLLPALSWNGDPLTTMVISGGAFGMGMFGLIFSLLPPKMRKLISWFGFTNSNRAVALKLLTVAALSGADSHGYFASFALCTYYGLILLMSGWQHDEKGLVEQYTLVLSRVSDRFPNGTLWILQRAKLARMQHDTQTAISILEEALEKGSTFREADSVLRFELSWVYLSEAKWLESADSFIAMRTLNSWSHATYVFIAAGALLDLPLAERTPEIEDRIDTLFQELPSLFGLKRLLGEPPSMEIFISRRLEVYKAKHARWVAAGRLPATSKYWEVARISPASELGLFWNTIGRAPAFAVHKQIDHLASFTPPLEFVPNSASTPKSSSAAVKSVQGASSTALPDLDGIDEIITRDLLLGTLYRALGEFDTAQTYLQSVIDREKLIEAEKWTVPFATFELAVVECKLGDRTVTSTDPSGAVTSTEADSAHLSMWKERLTAASICLDQIFAFGEYDHKSRLESRAQMLRDEILGKKSQLGLL